MTTSAPRKITRLYRCLSVAGRTIGDLTRPSGYTRSTVYDYLAGRTRRGDPETRAVLENQARALGVSWDGDPWAMVDDPRPRERKPARGKPQQPFSATGPLTGTDEEDDVIPTKTYLDPDDWTHFGLGRDPWDELELLDAWESPRTQYNERTLLRTITRREILAYVGDVGSGKSTTLRKLNERLILELPRVVWMSPGNLDRDEISEGPLAAAMLRDLGDSDHLSSSSERRGELLRQELDRRAREGDFPVLVIDEAHDLSVEGLIAIKRVWDSFTFNRSLAVILAGQLDLKFRLQRDARVRELAGRTRILEIPPMTVDEVRAYIGHRIQLSGGSLGSVFAEGAVEALHARGAVAPLWIDALAAQAMKHARTIGQRTVTAAVVARS